MRPYSDASLDVTDELKEVVARIQGECELRMADVLNIGQLDDGTCNVLVEWVGLEGGPTWEPAGDIYHDAPRFLEGRLRKMGLSATVKEDLRKRGRLLSKWDGDGRSEIMRFKEQVAQIESMHEKYSVPPEPIDWAGYKEVFGNHPEVIKAEQDYFSYTTPIHEPEDTSSIQQRMEPSFNEAAEVVEEAKLKVDELSERLSYLMANMTSEHTTVKEVFEKYPEIEKEVDDEIANHEWCTNLK